MGDTRLIHDAAFAAATALTEVLQPKPEHKRACHEHAYTVIKAAIEGYERQTGLKEERLGPSRN